MCPLCGWPLEVVAPTQLVLLNRHWVHRACVDELYHPEDPCPSWPA